MRLLTAMLISSYLGVNVVAQRTYPGHSWQLIHNNMADCSLKWYLVYVVSESGPKWAFEVTDTLEATTLLPGGSIIVLSYL